MLVKGYSEWMSALIEALIKLPGIGRRSAERIIFYFLKAKKSEVIRLAELLIAAKENIRFCQTCNNFSAATYCDICEDSGRDRGLMCVVEDPKDVVAIEKSGSYSGVYHVLLGSLSALDGIGPAEIEIQKLLERLNKQKVREIILATNPNTEGETTALYLSRLLKPQGIKITRIARGVPVGSNIEFVDQATLSRAFEGRAPA